MKAWQMGRSPVVSAAHSVDPMDPRIAAGTCCCSLFPSDTGTKGAGPLSPPPTCQQGSQAAGPARGAQRSLTFCHGSFPPSNVF